MPRGSARLWGAVLLCLLVTCFYLWLLRLELDVFVRKRHEWLCHFQLQHHAVLLRVLSPDTLGVTPGLLLPKLRELFGSDVLEARPRLVPPPPPTHTHTRARTP